MEKLTQKQVDKLYDAVNGALDGKLEDAMNEIKPLALAYRDALKSAIGLLLKKANDLRGVPEMLVVSAAEAGLAEMLIGLFLAQGGKDSKKQNFLNAMSLHYDAMYNESLKNGAFDEQKKD